MAEHIRDYKAEDIRAITLDEAERCSTLVFGPDIWSGMFEACLRLLFPDGHNYLRLRVALETDGTLCFGDDGPAYAAPHLWHSGTRGLVRETQKDSSPLATSFELAVLVRCSRTLSIRTKGGNDHNLLIGKNHSSERRSFSWEDNVQNFLRLSTGQPARSAAWVAGRLRDFAVGRPGLHVEVWDTTTGLVASFCYPNGVTDVLEEANSHLAGTLEPLRFTALGEGLACRIALQVYQCGVPTRLTFVRGTRLSQVGTEHDGLWEGIASALGLGDGVAVRRCIEGERWILGSVITLDGTAPIHLGRAWGSHIEDSRVQNMVSQCVATEFRQAYERARPLPGCSKAPLSVLAERMTTFDAKNSR